MSEYKQVKIGKLKLKGSAGGSQTKKKKKRKHEEAIAAEVEKDVTSANGWWCIEGFERLDGGTVALQTYTTAHVFAKDNGTLELGAQHDDVDEEPLQEEMFTMIRINETKVALKSGYGKYVSVNARGDILARSEAVGPQEQLEVVIEDKKVALQGHNGYFITITNDGEIKALSRTAKDKEIFKLRTNVARSKKKKVSEEETKDVRECEVSYVKQFQSFGDHVLKLHEGPKSSLHKARVAGKLHEAMLDRREKMKADRYCK